MFVPIIVDGRTSFDLATGSPYLALFSAILGGVDLDTDNGRRQAVEAIVDTGATQAERRSLSEIILGVASAAARKHLEELMSVSYRDPFVESWISQGDTRTKAADIIEALDARGIKTTQEQRAMVTESTDLAELNAWFKRALTASTAAEVFGD